MKILELRFKNLNSLYGEWAIDFTAPEYIYNGIFALTGPTGAGKSTILDAICLALYGATPRLGKITKSNNDIMSRQTGECYAEVVFESVAGRFRCHFEHRRSRKKAEGALQNPEHQIAEAETGKLIETKRALVLKKIEEKTGMDFDRFTRSILLAQGGFDTFLKADVEEKSKILEQITGTEIYSEISKLVHERKRTENEKLNILMAATSGITVLEPEQEKAIEDELSINEKKEKKLTSRLKIIEKEITWLNEIDKLTKEISSLSEESVNLERQIEEFKPEREKLDKALRAASLEGNYASLEAVRKQQAEDTAMLEKDEKLIPELMASVCKKFKILKEAETKTFEAKTEFKKASPLLKEVRALDQQLKLQMQEIKKCEKNCKKDNKEIISTKEKRDEVQKKINDTQKELVKVEDFLNKNKKDEKLVIELTGIEEKLKVLVSAGKEIFKLSEKENVESDHFLKLSKKIEKSSKDLELIKQSHSDILEKIKIKKNDLEKILDGKLLREYRTEKETLLREMAFHSKILELEAHRAKLSDGKPCPLCGSKDHPFAEGNIPAKDKIEARISVLGKLIQNAENHETEIQKWEIKEAEAWRKVTEIEKLEASVAHEKNVSERTLSEINIQINELKLKYEKKKADIESIMKNFGYNLNLEKPGQTISKLKNRGKKWQDTLARKDTIEKELSNFNSDLKEFEAVIKTCKTKLSEQQESLNTLKIKQSADADKRKRLYGDKIPDEEESSMHDAIAQAEKSEKKALKTHGDLEQKLNTLSSNAEALRKRISEREKELKEAGKVFISDLADKGFENEKEFLNARLSEAVRETMSLKSRKLDDSNTELKARKKDREVRLATEYERKLTEKTFVELEPEFNELNDELKGIRKLIAALKHQISENISVKEKIKEKMLLIDAQKKEAAKWEKLHILIGSADGKKFRNFAQGLTFELMVSHANIQLEKMSERYLLISDPKQPLELNVVDNYQAGEIRSTKNLSGGESFIVSLSLALGLSRMASRKVRVDSLFLDEGFGSLDEDTLETSIETLSGLQQDGKLIGIISHISAMKERISTQIGITPCSGGRSTISGPGCGRVNL